jgi:hypothetical protein
MGIPHRDFEHHGYSPGADRRSLVPLGPAPPARVPTRVKHGLDAPSRGAIVKQYQL